MPLFVGLWFEGRGHRLRALFGLLCATLITMTSSSSTPLMTYCAGVIAICFWPFRKIMRPVRWAIVMGLIFLQIVMKVPVWFVINRVSGLIGGTGWHRSELIDQFLRRFFEWCFIGTQSNANWGLDMWDTINAYVRAGVEGGLLTFALFLSIIVIGYRRIGLARSGAEQTDRHIAYFIWTLGAALFSNTVAFFGIIYFDQSVLAWYSLLVMISVVSAIYIQAPVPAISHVEVMRSLKRSAPQDVQPTGNVENQRTPVYTRRIKHVVE